MGRGMGMRDDRMLDRAAAPPLNAPISPPVVTTPPANPAPPPQPKFEVTLPPLNTGPPKFDVLQDGIFPSLQWLRQCGIALCRWAGENNDWSRLAFSLPDSLVATVIGPEGSALQDLQNRSGCRMKIERERFRGPMGPEKETSFLCLERIFGKFQRAFEVRGSVNLGEVSARMANGILVITIPKIADRRGRERRIPVTTG